MTEYVYTPGIYNPPANSHYTELNTKNVSDDIIKISIGSKGKIFKAITHKSNVHYIWFNGEQKKVEIWGPEKNLPDAVNRIGERNQTIIDKVENGEIVLTNKKKRRKIEKNE